MAAAPGEKDPRSLHELALDIAQDINLLATGLAHAGAPPQITDKIAETSKLYMGVAKGLAAGPVGGAPAAPGAGGPPQGAPAPAGGPPPSPSAPPPGPAPGPGTPQNVAPARGPIHNALAEAHAQHLAAMAKAR